MDEARRSYGQLAGQYIDLFDGVDEVHPDDLDLIVRLLDRPGPVLDVGCGPGHLTGHLCSLGVDATGIDPVPEFIAHGRGAHPGGPYALGSLPALPIADGVAAGILAWYSLIHLAPDEMAAALAELHRTLAPNGVLVIGFFDGDLVDAFDHLVTTAYRWPADELSARLERAGFAEIERLQRPGIDVAGHRPHAAIAARVL